MRSRHGMVTGALRHEQYRLSDTGFRVDFRRSLLGENCVDDFIDRPLRIDIVRQ